MLLVILPALTVWKVWSSSVWLPLSYSSTERGLLLTGGSDFYFFSECVLGEEVQIWATLQEGDAESWLAQQDVLSQARHSFSTAQTHPFPLPAVLPWQSCCPHQAEVWQKTLGRSRQGCCRLQQSPGHPLLSPAARQPGADHKETSVRLQGSGTRTGAQSLPQLCVCKQPS